MIEDIRNLPADTPIRADLCVIGAGPAGISLVLPLIGSGIEICLIESGGLDWEPETYELNEGELRGIPYQQLRDARFRGLGGTALKWELDAGLDEPTARYRPLDPLDFARRDWVPQAQRGRQGGGGITRGNEMPGRRPGSLPRTRPFVGRFGRRASCAQGH